jgi:hypothetical protein
LTIFLSYLSDFRCSEEKDADTEKKREEKSLSPEKDELKAESRPKPASKIRVKFGYSDSEGSDLSEMGFATKPLTAITTEAEQAATSNLVFEKPIGFDNFFDDDF